MVHLLKQLITCSYHTHTYYHNRYKAILEISATMSNYEGSPKIALTEGIIKFCSLLFRQTTLFGSLTLCQTVPKYQNACLRYFLRNKKICISGFCLAVQCTTLKMSILYVVVKAFTSFTITYTFKFQKKKILENNIFFFRIPVYFLKTGILSAHSLRISSFVY